MNLLSRFKDLVKPEKEYVFVEAPDKDLGDMLEIKIYGFEWDPVKETIGVKMETQEGRQRFITMLKRMYNGVLKADPRWHYFNEDYYMIIRFSEKFVEDVADILILHEAGTGDFYTWIDEQSATRKYQHIFEKMFHSFSVMAMQNYDESEFSDILDRVIHCFFNHQLLFIPKLEKAYGTNVEAKLVSLYASARAQYVGYIQGVRRMQKQNEEKVNG